jgi:hypothetical protein
MEKISNLSAICKFAAAKIAILVPAIAALRTAMQT